MACPECGQGAAGWCKFCGEDVYRSQRRVRWVYIAIILLMLGLLAYFILNVGISAVN